jgi:hypothetical protein
MLDLSSGAEKVEIKKNNADEYPPSETLSSPWWHTIAIALGCLKIAVGIPAFIIWLIKRSKCYTDVVERALPLLLCAYTWPCQNAVLDSQLTGPGYAWLNR